MKTSKILCGLMITIILFLTACAKKEPLSKQSFYAKIVVDVANLPGTPKLEVRYGGKALGEAPIIIPGIPVEIGKNIKMSVYVKGTNELVSDTVLNLKNGESASYKVAYNKDLGISGWINSKPVSPDSLSFQLLNNLSAYYKKYPSIDLRIDVYNYDTGNFDETGVVIPDFMKIKLSAANFRLPYADAHGNTNIYFVRLYDSKTGALILSPSGSEFAVIPQEYGGANYIFNIIDDAGEISISTIYI